MASQRGKMRQLEKIGVVFAIATVTACTPAPAPIPAPPPPPIYVAPPPPPVRPLPPGGAAATMIVPPIGVDGIRTTPNRFISANENVWHLRAAINVAALNCQGPVWNQIADNYNIFLANNKLTLRKISREIDSEYRGRYPGENPLRVRDTKMTDLYNYFSLPTVKQEYCDMALAKSQEASVVDYRVIREFGASALADIDGIFIRFFDSYAQYQADLAAWNQMYAPSTLNGTPTNTFAPASPGFDQPILEVADDAISPFEPAPASPTGEAPEIIFVPNEVTAPPTG